MKMLIIEDDLGISYGLSRAFEHQGFNVNCAQNGQNAIDMADRLEPELVILDLGLPDVAGLSLLTQLRQDLPAIPILILTGRDDMKLKIAALDKGADDYLTKPFEMEELMARVRVQVRRMGTAINSVIRIRSVTLNLVGNRVSVAGKILSLTSRELVILKSLMQNAGRIQTKTMIEQRLHGWSESRSSNAIEVHMSNLRKKLPTHFIRTVRGLGYTVDPSQDHDVKTIIGH